MLLALGYHLTFDPQYTSNHRLKTMKLPNKSVMTLTHAQEICTSNLYM